MRFASMLAFALLFASSAFAADELAVTVENASEPIRILSFEISVP